MDSLTERDPTLFIGRTAFLQVLHTTLQANRAVVISGPAGSGKTALAHEYARRFATHYQEIHGMQVSTREMQLITGIELAHILSLPLQPDQKLLSALPLLREWLATRQNYLFILDNSHDLALLEAILPPERAGFLLLLTSSPELYTSMPVLELGELEIEEGAQLLLSQRGQDFAQVTQEQRLVALELARALNGSPLALKIASSFIHEASSDLPTYLQLYRTMYQRSSEELKPDGDLTAALGTTYRLALHMLAEKYPLATNVLRFCALLHSELILNAFFVQGLAYSCEALQEFARDPQAFDTVSSVLLTYGLIERQGGPLMFRVPPLVQSILMAEMTQTEQQQRVKQLLYAFHRMMPRYYNEVPVQYHLCYLGHIRQVATYGEQLTSLFKEAAEVFSWAAGILYAQEDFRAATDFLSRALLIWESIMGTEVPAVMTLQHNLAAFYEYLEDYAEAESLLHKVIVARAQALGALHADTIASLHNLGVVYAKQSKWEAAEATYRKALSLCELGTNLEHPLALTTQLDLAVVYLARHQWELAEPVLQRIDNLFARVMGPQHPQTLRAHQALAITYVALQQWELAEPFLLSINNLYERNPDTGQDEALNTLQLLALVYAVQEKWQAAEQVLLRNTHWQTRELAGNELETARILHLLSLIFMGQEHWERAILFLQRAIEIYEQLPEEARPDIAECYEQLLLLRVQQGDMAGIDRILRKAQEIMEKKIAGPDTWETVTALSQLAIIYIGQKRLEEADRLLQRVVEISQRVPELEPLLLSEELSLLADARAAEEGGA